MKDAPVIRIIEDAKAKFMANYGFPAETLHVSPAMEKALSRWVKENTDSKVLAIAGLDVRRMTKATPHVEFYLAAVRDGHVYSQRAVLEPEDVGAVKSSSPEIIKLGGEDAIQG